jgi:Methylamine utilisation protein MauE
MGVVIPEFYVHTRHTGSGARQSQRLGVTVNSGFWAPAAFDAVASAWLINAGIAKLVAPGPLVRATAEVLAAPRGAIGKPAVRGLGAVELTVAVALLVRPARPAAAIACFLLGCCFALAGILGVLRRSSVPCGCFGGTSKQPLGWANVGLGALLAVVWPVNVLIGPVTAQAYTTAAVLLASIGSAIVCLCLNRRLLMPLFGGRRAPQARSEVSLCLSS